jgi:hypothetical protein
MSNEKIIRRGGFIIRICGAGVRVEDAERRYRKPARDAKLPRSLERHRCTGERQVIPS